jgi:cell division protein FtsI (penicillin-binding protein 3)
MASTIANGGEYLPPHILLESSNGVPGGQLLPVAFHPGHEVPDPLPEGAHRVISTMTAAQMRRMMESVVEHGTGLPAQLNGYSAAGKTGTAEKIDPRTHTYSKTNYIASFVGFAPVNDPAISIAIVMDSPSYQYHYGNGASAPVFHDLAQQILEYLGVPHDQPLKSTQEMAAIENAHVEDDEPAQSTADLESLFDAVNDLPADDPLRAQVDSSAQLPDSKAQEEAGPNSADGSASAKPVSQAANAAAPVSAPAGKPAQSASPPPLPTKPKQDVVVAPGKRVAVPSLIGQPVRSVIERAGGAGLGVQVIGSGIARQQVPAAGTMVPPGTQIVVRFGR